MDPKTPKLDIHKCGHHGPVRIDGCPVCEWLGPTYCYTNALESSPELIQNGWYLLRCIAKVNSRGLMHSTVIHLFCDSFAITPNRAARLLNDLGERGHVKVELGWVKL